MREIVSPLDGFASPFGPQRGFNPLRIFANDEPGVWFEANDANTLFTDVAGTTPVTTPGDAVALQLDKSGRGNHRTQATTAARPLYALHPVGGVRNLLQYTEEFDNAIWSKLNSTVTANATTAPDGTSTAEKLIPNSGSNYSLSYVLQVVSAGSEIAYTYTVYAKAAELDYILITLERVSDASGYYFNLSTGAIGSRFGATGTAEIEDVGGGWYRCSFTKTSSASTANYQVRIYATPTDPLSGTGDGTSGIFIWGAQAELGSTATNYQRVGSFLDVSEEGKARRGRLWYNGTSHFMQTGTITPGTDKVQVFAGVRKLSDAAGILVESSATVNSNAGSFYLVSGEDKSTRYSSLGRGSASAAGAGAAKWADGGFAPDTAVLTTTHDIAGDLSRIRRNGVFGVDATGDKGTGNFLAYPLYFGARAGASFRFNGYEDTSIIRFGPNLDETTINKVESYVASKTPEPTL